MIKKWVFSGSMIAFIMVVAFLSGVGPVKAKELRYGDEIFNNRRADYYGWHRMMDLIEERSKGQVTFKRLTKATVGMVAQTTEAVQKGTLDMTITWATTLGMHSKSAGAFVLPFLFNLPEDMIWNITSPESRELMDVVEKEAGMKLITVGIYEERSFFNNKKPIRRIEDVKGMRIRTMESPDEQFWVALTGARPAPSSFPELYNMLKTGVFDGYDGNFSVHDSMKYYEVNKYLAVMGYHYLVPFCAMSLKAWDGLTPDEKKLFMETARQAVLENYPVARRQVERSKKVALQAGNVINEIEDIEKWREVVKPAYDKKMNESPAAKKFVEAVWEYHKKYPRWPTDLNQPVPATKW